MDSAPRAPVSHFGLFFYFPFSFLSSPSFHILLHFHFPLFIFPHPPPHVASTDISFFGGGGFYD